MQYHVFLSYSRADLVKMKQIKEALMAKGLDIWTDDDLTPGTHSWKIAIQSAIEQSGSMVVLLSPDAKKSEWVDRELEYARVQNVRIFPVLIRGDDTQSVPFEVVATQRIDLTKPENYDFGIEQLYDALAKYLGIRLPPRESDLEDALFTFGEKLPDVSCVAIVTYDGLLKAGINLESRETGFKAMDNQVAAMLATLLGLADRTGKRFLKEDMVYVSLGLNDSYVLGIDLYSHGLIIVFDEIVSIDKIMISVQRAIRQLLSSLQEMNILDTDKDIRF